MKCVRDRWSMAAAAAAEGLEVESGEALEEMVAAEFRQHHDGGVARINHGSFGSCPSSVLRAQARWSSLWLQQPDHFYFGPLDRGLLASRHAVAAFIRATHVDQVVLLDNVTVGVSMVLQKLAWDFLEGRYQKGDAVLAFNFAYGAVKKALQAYLLRAGAHLIEVKLPFPVSSEEEILGSVASALQRARSEGRKIRFALLDHITSVPCILLPVRELVAMCRSAGVSEILVDGAHAPGNVCIDVEEIDADYYTGNLHKWLFAPHSVAFLHCKADHLPNLHHPIVSHNYQNGLSSECAWVGTRDYSSLLAAFDAIEFFKRFKGGVQAVQDYNHQKVVSIGKMLAEDWGTHCGTPPELCSSMVMVGLPGVFHIRSDEDALNLRTLLRQEFGVEVPVYFLSDASLHDGLEDDNGAGNTHITAYVRISHQIYNSKKDYARLRDAIEVLKSRVQGSRVL